MPCAGTQKLHPEQWAGPWVRGMPGGAWRQDQAGIRLEHLAQMREWRAFQRDKGCRSGPSGGLYDDPYRCAMQCCQCYSMG